MPRRLIQVITPPMQTALTTATAVKAEIPSATPSQALRIPALIEQASELIVGYIGRELALATVKETYVWGQDLQQHAGIILSRPPVSALVSVAFDGVEQDLATIDYDENAGLIYRHAFAYNLDYNIVPGYGYGIGFGYRTEIEYDGGYVLPGQVGRNLPHAIERACIDVVLALWYRSSRGDPMIRGETIDGIGSTQYLDPAPGPGAVMPPAALAALSPFVNYAV